RRRQLLAPAAARLSPLPLRRAVADGLAVVADRHGRLAAAAGRSVEAAARRLETAAKLLESYSYENVLQRGYAVVWDAHGRTVSSAEQTAPGDIVTLEFAKGKAEAVIARRAAARPKPRPAPVQQGSLFPPKP